MKGHVYPWQKSAVLKKMLWSKNRGKHKLKTKKQTKLQLIDFCEIWFHIVNLKKSQVIWKLHLRKKQA